MVKKIGIGLIAGVALLYSAASAYDLNKDFKNCTGQTVNDIHVLLNGNVDVTETYDGVFGAPTVTHPDASSTLLTWSGTNVVPNQVVHVGWSTRPKGAVSAGHKASLKEVWFTLNGVKVDDATQVSVDAVARNLVLTNDITRTSPTTLFVGNVSVEWYHDQQALSTLNPSTPRTPLRTDVLQGPALSIITFGSATIGATIAGQTPPAGARYAVFTFTTDNSGTLTNCPTRDFYQVDLASFSLPMAGTTGLLLLTLAMLIAAAWVLRRRQTMPA